MSIMIDLPPDMAQEAQGYAAGLGTTVEQVLFDSLRKELDRKRKSDVVYEYLMNQNGWLPDDFVFNREEANAR